MDTLHPKDAKNNCDQIERELQRTEEVIKSMFNDVQVLRDNRYNQANELHRRYNKSVSVPIYKKFVAGFLKQFFKLRQVYQCPHSKLSHLLG